MRLGILGGGQLARMLSLAAYPLGIRPACLDPSADACASQVSPVVLGNFNDADALSRFLEKVDLVTYETENIPLDCALSVSKTHSLYPSASILQIAQDRLLEKTFFKNLGIPTPKFYPINSKESLQEACAQLNFPAVLKTRRMGYDGKGQILLQKTEDIANAWATLEGQDLILEEFVRFTYEVSQICVRSSSKETRFYPLVHNHHQQGILRWSEAPHNQEKLQGLAQQYAKLILEKMNYVGILTIEFFFDGAQLLANEMAPRVHNSGHWTIEGSQTSQFDNHLRAIFNWPLGSTDTLGHCFMLNCIGQMPNLGSTLAIPGAHYHAYGKSSKPLRKLGHVTLVEPDAKRYDLAKAQILSLLSPSCP
jgi:5-(carboxyamino)imidazole ribonucleotide synthase